MTRRSRSVRICDCCLVPHGLVLPTGPWRPPPALAGELLIYAQTDDTGMRSGVWDPRQVSSRGDSRRASNALERASIASAYRGAAGERARFRCWNGALTCAFRSGRSWDRTAELHALGAERPVSSDGRMSADVDVDL